MKQTAPHTLHSANIYGLMPNKLDGGTSVALPVASGTNAQPPIYKSNGSTLFPANPNETNQPKTQEQLEAEEAEAAGFPRAQPHLL